MLKLLATGPPVIDWTSSASDGKASLRVGVGGVDGDLARQAGDLAQRRRDGRARDRHQHHISIAGVAAIAPQHGYLMPGLAPQRGQASPNASTADGDDLHWSMPGTSEARSTWCSDTSSRCGPWYPLFCWRLLWRGVWWRPEVAKPVAG